MRVLFHYICLLVFLSSWVDALPAHAQSEESPASAKVDPKPETMASPRIRYGLRGLELLILEQKLESSAWEESVAVTLPGPGYELQTYDKYLFVAVGARGLSVLDISDPRKPILLRTLSVGGSAHRLELRSGQLIIMGRLELPFSTTLDLAVVPSLLKSDASAIPGAADASSVRGGRRRGSGLLTAGLILLVSGAVIGAGGGAVVAMGDGSSSEGNLLGRGLGTVLLGIGGVGVAVGLGLTIGGAVVRRASGGKPTCRTNEVATRQSPCR